MLPQLNVATLSTDELIDQFRHLHWWLDTLGPRIKLPLCQLRADTIKRELIDRDVIQPTHYAH